MRIHELVIGTAALASGSLFGQQATFAEAKTQIDQFWQEKSQGVVMRWQFAMLPEISSYLRTVNGPFSPVMLVKSMP
jgi:hypothetical protein